MSDTSAELSRIASTLELVDGLALVFIVGPDFRAPEGLSLIRVGLPDSRPTLWHRMDRDGPDVVSAVERAQMDDPIVLVHGLENLEEEARASLESSLNMLRDRLALIRATLIFWVPRSDLEAFQRHCADLFAWRSLLVSLSEEQVQVDPDLEARRIYLSRLRAELERLSAAALAPLLVQPEFLSDRMVLPEGEQAAIPLAEWLKRTPYGVLVGEAAGGKTTALMALALLWAREAAEAPHGAPCPLFITARDLYRGPTFGLNLDEEEMPVIAFPSARFAEWARAGALVLMMDGLDELEEPARGLCLEWLERLRERYPQLRMTVTNRTPIKELRFPWTKARLEPLTFAQLRAHLGELTQPSQQYMLQAALGNLETLQQSRTDTLLLPSNLLAKFLASGSLGIAAMVLQPLVATTTLTAPMGATLLGALIGYLLGTRGGPDVPYLKHVNPRTVEWLLSWLAFRALTQETHEVFDKDISDALPNLRRRAGVSIPVPESNEEAALLLHETSKQLPWIITETGPHRFRFAHPLFQAFFAADWLANGEPGIAARLLTSVLEQHRWRSVAIMSAGQFAQRSAKQAREFIDELLRIPVLPGAAEMRRLALALDCARAAQLPSQELSKWQARAEQLCCIATNSKEEKLAQKELCDALERQLDSRRST
ncbi:MAG TPA: NACHT domain-containing protein [Archangium sp.]|nr:NACHT domain-containing protein [Archangium sp.]